MKKPFLNEDESFRPYFLGLLKAANIYHDRIEPSKGMQVGIPDVFCLVDDKAVFVELKVGEIKDGILFCRDIRPAQFNWHHTYRQAGGTSFFVCGVIEGQQWLLCKFGLDSAVNYTEGLSVGQYELVNSVTDLFK